MVTRYRPFEVLPIVEQVVDWLAPHAQRVAIAGSLRRGAETVKDVELVILEPKPSYFAELDRALAAGEIEKARLGETGATRWGPRYRSILVAGVTIELYCCDGDNAGYQMWLRTGPADANEYMVTQIKYRNAAWRIDKGYLYAVSTDLEQPPRKLSVPTEADFFALCGLPYLAPDQRSVSAYMRLMRAREFRWGNPAAYVKPDDGPLQASLFDDVPQAAARHDVANGSAWVAQVETDLALDEFRRRRAEAHGASGDDWDAWWRAHEHELVAWYENPDLQAPPPQCWIERHGPWEPPV